MRNTGFLSLRGKGRGGYGGGRSGGRSFTRGRPPSSIRVSPHKGVYGHTRTGNYGGVNKPGSYNWSARYNSRGQLMSVSRGYGMGQASGFGQPGTGRGSFRISPRNYSQSFGRNVGGGASAARSVVSGTGGGGSAGGDGPGGGTGDGPNTPGAAAGPFRVPRERESRARARAEIRGSRALATRRALKIGSSGGASINTGRRGGTGVQV